MTNGIPPLSLVSSGETCSETQRTGIRDDCAFVQYGGICKEIAERKRAENRLHREKIAAEEKVRNYARLIAGSSHDLRTPLNAIMGYSDMIQKGLHLANGGDRSKEYAEAIQAAAGHLLDLIGDVLDLCRMDAFKLELHEEPTDVASLLEEAAVMIRERTERGGIRFSTIVEPGLRAVTVDRRRILQVLLNLLSNAAKFTPQGGRIIASARTALGGGLDIRIADDGVGMEKDHIAKALTEFVQVAHGTQQQDRSSGLGLPLAKRLIDLHGGTMAIDSTPGHGATVSFILPKSRWCKAEGTGAQERFVG